MPTVNIDLDTVFFPVEVGMTRARLFSILNYNALSEIESFDEWKVPGSDFFKLTVNTSEPFEITKKNFLEWTNRNLIRELVESLYITFDAIHLLCLFSEAAEKDTHRIKVENYNLVLENQKTYLNLTMDKKFQSLKAFQIALNANEKKIFKGLKDIRDNLAHRGGITTNLTGHSAQNKNRKITWFTLKAYLKSDSGKKTKLVKETYVKEKSTVIIEFKEHSKILSVGKYISFDTQEVFEIAMTVGFLVDRLKKQLIERVKNAGMKLEAKVL